LEAALVSSQIENEWKFPDGALIYLRK